MTPETFVEALASSVRQGASSEADYFAVPTTNRPPPHLAQFSNWFRKLSPLDQVTARKVIKYAADGCLFRLLTYLDNISSLTQQDGLLELWYAAADGTRLRLNDPSGEMLTDIFNNLNPPLE